MNLTDNQTTQTRGSQQGRANPPADPRDFDNRQDEGDFDIPADGDVVQLADNRQGGRHVAGPPDTGGQIPDREFYNGDIAEGDEVEHGGSTGRGDRGRSSRLAETR